MASLNTSQYLGYTDWRLPNRKELHSLTAFSRYNPALPSGHPFNNVQAQAINYWSSTTYVYRTDWAWTADIYGGWINYWVEKIDTCNIWPVRTGQVPFTGCSGWSDVIGKYNT